MIDTRTGEQASERVADDRSAPGAVAWLRARWCAIRRLGLAGPLGVAALGAFLLLLDVHHLLWMRSFRSGLPLDIDEAGYLGFSFDDLHGWTHGGFDGLYQAVIGQRQFGPLVPLTASPLLGILGPKPVGAMTVQLVYLAVLGFSVLGLGRALVGARLGLLVAMVSLLLPSILDFGRSFHLVIASTALLCASVWALVRSDGLDRRGFAVTAGVFAGLLLLSRTMTVAFLPGLGLAAIVGVCGHERRDRGRRIANLALAAVVGCLVAAWWYVPNLSVIFRYLTNYGYGGQSARNANADTSSVLSWSYWTARLRQILDAGLQLGVTTVIAVTVVAAVVTVVWRRRATRPTGDATVPHGGAWSLPRVVGSLASPAGTVGIVLVVSYLVLSSSRNGGTGFTVPLLPLVVLLWGVALQSVHWRSVRIALAGALVAAVLVSVVTKAGVGGSLAGQRCVSVPALDCVHVYDGRGTAQQLPWAQAWASADPSRARRGVAGGWVDATGAAASFALRYAKSRGVEPIVFFASRDPIFNTNSVGLAGRTTADHAIPMGQLVADPGGDTVRNYRRHLDDPRFGQPNLLITVGPPGPFEYRPHVDQAKAEHAARELGFRPVHRLRLPDGRVARFFWLQRGPVLP